MAHYFGQALARQIARKGSPVAFVRAPFSGPDIVIPTFAMVRGYRPEELNAGVTLDWRMVTFAGETFTDAGITPQKGDAVRINGRRCVVEAVGLFWVAEELVRVELQVVGP